MRHKVWIIKVCNNSGGSVGANPQRRLMSIWMFSAENGFSCSAISNGLSERDF
jgi:hypothetical protein